MIETVDHWGWFAALQRGVKHPDRFEQPDPIRHPDRPTAGPAPKTKQASASSPAQIGAFVAGMN